MSAYGGASSSSSATPVTSRRLYRAPTQTLTTPRKYGATATTVSTPGSAGRSAPTSDLPMSVVFDDIMRHFDYYTSCGSENEFLDFIDSQEDCRRKWYNAEQEALRMSIQIKNLQGELQRNEKKMTDFRRQFESKLEVVTRLEAEKEAWKTRSTSANLLMQTYLNDAQVSYDVKDKVANILATLEGVELKHRTVKVASPRGLDTISEADTTDLSMTQSEDDLDFSVRRTRGGRSKRRSEVNMEQEISRKKIRTSKGGSRQTVESYGTTDQVISKTIVSIPRSGGPIHATSTLETMPSSGYGANNRTHVTHSVQPSAPPMTGTSESETEQPYHTNTNMKLRSSTSKNKEVTESPRFGRTLSSASNNMKSHAWVEKTILARETCCHCNKSIRFAKIALRCKNCRTTCHPECKDNVPLPCVTASSTPSSRKGQLGVIADYTPSTHPMVPALIQHCVNEIEIRGLATEGLYRVPGLEREVKELKERFLRGKGIPNLAVYDPHTICGTIKDFLRSLREPLVGRWFWRDFALATDISDPLKRQKEIHRALEELPPPNQDTLAFFILHLQRVAEIEHVKMPLSNMAKVFGPALIGYSGPGLDASAMLQETKKQQIILGTLLSMSAEYWRRYINRTTLSAPPAEVNNAPRKSSRTTRFSSIGKARANTLVTSTPMIIPPSAQNSNNKGLDKKIYFQDESPQESMKIHRPKRNYFD